jgi:hypothetical protein
MAQAHEPRAVGQQLDDALDHALLAVAVAVAASLAVAPAAGPALPRPLVLVGVRVALDLDQVAHDVGLLVLGLLLLGLLASVEVVGGATPAAAPAAAPRARRRLGGGLVDDVRADADADVAVVVVALAPLVGDDALDELGLAQAAEAVDPELGGDRVQIGERAGLQRGAGQNGHGSSFVGVGVGRRPGRVVSAPGDPVRRTRP